jgi:hypothetical protein
MPALAQAPDPDAARLCANQDPCRAQRSDAGRGADGHALSIIELTLGETNADGLRCRDNRRQFWLLAEGAAPRLLLDLCNDGYGAAGMGEDEIAITPNQLVYTQNGGSNWRWAVTRTVRLSPLAVVGEASEGSWTMGPNAETRSWDWTQLAGRARWWSPPCRPGHHAPDGETMADAPDPLPYEYAPIPRLDPAAAPGALAAELGSCAMRIDAGGEGFVARGRADAQAASREWLRALALGERDLLITVGTGPWRSGGPTWQQDDRVELWVGDTFGYASGCLVRDDRPSQWAIRIADGRVFRGAGPGALRPEVVARRERREDGARIVTLHLRLAEQTQGITAALARGDGRRTIATARLRGASATSLGQRVYVPAAALRCAVRDGRLDVVETGRVEMLRGEGN